MAIVRFITDHIIEVGIIYVSLVLLIMYILNKYSWKIYEDNDKTIS
jgi:hypothetical protein